ncbi:MAG: extracellular solute-binding protein [Gammaproteobacteria bacterium]|nr:extracellular solute-binding protein [Gammaproteobacteria bacterium]MDD9799856.1 extracellular solute-binding protein [Gammaproteobacteria bacterium]MDD9815365.1 extracellular solute-binding protein [Gammaproteobacteria bacterium]MDD9871687.1 extracellular solute-binding protein [Gammaproteobacteria bacterium]
MIHEKIAAGAVLAALALLPSAAAANPYQAYSGTTLVVSFPNHPHYDAVDRVLPEFTRETGIKVEVDKLQYTKMRDKQLLEMAKPRGDYDLVAYVVFSKTDFVAKDLIEPLAPYFLNPALADPDYDPGDLIDVYVENAGLVGGKKGYLPGPTAGLYGVPFGAETSVLAYRRDIFEKHNLQVPTTYDALLDVACRIPELEPGMGGLASRSQSGHQIIHAWLLHLAPLGGRIFDDHWNPIFNQAPGVQAAETLKQILACGPKGGAGQGFGGMKELFLQGKTAMFLDSTVVSGEVDDPNKSRIVGKVGWALHPTGIRRGSQTGGFGIAIPRNSQNKEAAFLLMQWLTSKAVDKKIALAGGSPNRKSTFADPAMQRQFPHFAVFGEALKYADADWRPLLPVWVGELKGMIGPRLSESIVGDAPIQATLDELARRTRQVMEREGFYTYQ